jgi:hypothetical protein
MWIPPNPTPLTQQTSSPVLIPVLVEFMLLMVTHLCLHVFSSLLRCPVRFQPKTMLDSCDLTLIWFVGVHVLIMSIVFIYVCWCPTRFPYHILFVSFNSNTTGATCGTGTVNPCEEHEFTPAVSGIRVSRSSVFCIKFCRSLFVLFSCWPLCCHSTDLFFWLPLWYLQTFFI